MDYIFLNQNKTLVGRIDDDGIVRSSGDPASWEEYLDWISEGNKTIEWEPPVGPLPQDSISEPEPLTPQQKLEAAGLTVEELKELLGL
jgi:hypothetical protein